MVGESSEVGYTSEKGVDIAFAKCALQLLKLSRMPRGAGNNKLTAGR